MLKIKNVFVRFLCIAVIVAVTSVDSEAVSVSAQSAVLMCVQTGEVLFSRNAEKRLSMASTTKIMTALLLIEQNTPEKVVNVTKEMTAVEGTSMGLLPGGHRNVSLARLRNAFKQRKRCGTHICNSGFGQ